MMGSAIGGRAIMTEMLDVADRFGVEPVVEAFLRRAVSTAIPRVRTNAVRFRAVLLAA